jgi:FkbM family methyltransferase
VLGYLGASDQITVTVGETAASFHVDSLAEYDRVSTFVGEEELIRDMIERIEITDRVWDVGANIGTHSILLAKTIPGVELVAYEPHPTNAERLRENITLNNLTNVHVEEIALGDTEERTDLFVTGDDVGVGGHSMLADAANSIRVTVKRGDDVVNKTHGIPNVIKIDVEGAEKRVLSGLDATLRSPVCRLVFCEVHSVYGVRPAEVERLLSNKEFEVEWIDKRGTTLFLRAQKRSPS